MLHAAARGSIRDSTELLRAIRTPLLALLYPPQILATGKGQKKVGGGGVVPAEVCSPSTEPWLVRSVCERVQSPCLGMLDCATWLDSDKDMNRSMIGVSSLVLIEIVKRAPRGSA